MFHGLWRKNIHLSRFTKYLFHMYWIEVFATDCTDNTDDVQELKASFLSVQSVSKKLHLKSIE